MQTLQVTDEKRLINMSLGLKGGVTNIWFGWVFLGLVVISYLGGIIILHPFPGILQTVSIIADVILLILIISIY